ncbi:unnamed protein product [Lactuca saligna]|uniref:Ribosomal RNA large subunit methyltransferase K/L-like methyltransferase domain-containing protein n=1 Tax=Lactuca saligna TaxID=75948 RepID=A0AA35ZGD4_LACSI|nr:unnamed protein product [Lactuca saligna]
MAAFLFISRLLGLSNDSHTFSFIPAADVFNRHVIGIDVDDESLEIASINADNLEVEIGLIQCEIKNLNWRGQIVDTVVMNPPFGTRKKGADMEFLSVALKRYIHCTRQQQEKYIFDFFLNEKRSEEKEDKRVDNRLVIIFLSSTSNPSILCFTYSIYL